MSKNPTGEIVMLLLRVLVAAALLLPTTGVTVFARGSHELPRHRLGECAVAYHAAEDTKPRVFPTARCIDGGLSNTASPGRTVTAMPSRQPGGVCDVGDNPMIC